MTVRVRDFGANPGFPGAAFPATWCPLALANKRANFDFFPVFPGTTVPFPDIFAQFSSDFDFYLGLDGNHGSQVDLVTIVLHELAHGLGFSSSMNPGTGAVPACPPANCTDIYLRFAHDGVSQTQFSAMTTNAQRATAAAQVDNVVWTGTDVAAAVPFTLNFGRPQVSLSGGVTLTTRVGPASFGPPLTAAGISQNVVVGNDGVVNPAPGASVTDACEPLINRAARSRLHSRRDRCLLRCRSTSHGARAPTCSIGRSCTQRIRFSLGRRSRTGISSRREIS